MLNWLLPQYLPDWVQHIILPLNRWLHIVCTTLIVGGTLFYEFVIPQAIADLKEETQLAVLGRVRWFFRNVVIFSALALIVTGSLSCYQQWRLYNGLFRDVRWWIFLHIGLGIVALLIAVAAMVRTRAPRSPLTWLRVNFVILLIVIFVAAISRHMRMTERDNMDKFHVPTPEPSEVR